MSDVSHCIFEGVEVAPTGRIAVKRTTSPLGKNVEDKLVEIRPIDKEGPTWVKWVHLTDLYHIE